MRSAGIASRSRHEGGAVLADRDEAVDGAHLLPDQGERLLPVGRRRPFRKSSSPCSVQHTGRFSASRSGAASAIEQRVRQVDDVGQRLVAGPLDELVELLAKHAPVALQHRDRQVAEQPRIGGTPRLANA